MQKCTSVSLGEHFDTFIAKQIKGGRFSPTREVIRAGLRLLEERELKLTALRQALKEGEASGMAEYSFSREPGIPNNGRYLQSYEGYPTC